MSHRAYVGIANLTANLEAGEIQIMLQNIGNVPAKAVWLEGQEIRVTPAVNDESTRTGERVNDRQVGSQFTWDAGNVELFRGTPLPADIQMRKFMREEVSAILESKQIVYVAGKIYYDDGFGNRESTTFAFKYNPHGTRWIVHSDLSKY